MFSYPSTYINEQFQRFFMKYTSSSSSQSLLPLIANEQEFFVLREKLFAQPSIKQILMTKSANTVEIISNVRQNGQTTIAITKVTVNRKNIDKFINNIFIHCVHESRFHGLQQHIHEIHDSFFKNTDYRNIRLIVGHRTNPKLNFQLSRKRPRASLLKDPLKKSRYTYSNL
ncbi:unnamed protein product [Adineta steineri]|uniref:Uncharacterized protein n=1 Tax=Adineta steineri TaxID=433720 RepID=A0A820AW35_9BILA|nr:unnamed protein product [Adineta steineri]